MRSIGAPALGAGGAGGGGGGGGGQRGDIPAEAGAGRGRGAPPGPRFGSLKVVTTQLKPGYLRKNGVPYSENAVLTEHWDLYKRPNGEEWLTITTQIEDPQYLSNVKLIAPIFKKERDGSKWDPTPCSARW